jgi:hypothetical protein
MTTPLQDGVALLASILKDYESVAVTYNRGQGSVSIAATRQMHQYEVVDAEGFGITMLSRDYIIQAADLILNGSEVTPRPGDRIVETIRSVSETFEVMAIGQMKEYEPLDTDGVMLKIHTKRITQ